jgi:hypothetical protein
MNVKKNTKISGLSIFFKSTASTSLFTGDTFYYKIGTIFMNILCNKHSLKSGGTKDILGS